MLICIRICNKLVYFLGILVKGGYSVGQSLIQQQERSFSVKCEYKKKLVVSFHSNA